MQKILKFILIVSFFALKMPSVQAQRMILFMDVAGIAGENVTNNARNAVSNSPPSSQTIALLSATFAESANLKIKRSIGGIESGNPNNIREMLISFKMDKASPLLFDKMWKQQRISSINVYFDMGTNVQDEFQRIKLSSVLIKSMTIQSAYDDAPTINMTITYEQILRGFSGRNQAGTLVSLGTHCYDYKLLVAGFTTTCPNF
ncbi:type VI secretion system tube protein Hcp [Emticicia sp.]|uniref:type VI secretion system tube protein Hcp n=1 Tax=Emticicia sp. TaxID=1930953 RepID=UPI003750BF70